LIFPPDYFLKTLLAGFTNEQITLFTNDSHMVALPGPEVPEEKQEAIWDLAERYIEETVDK